MAAGTGSHGSLFQQTVTVPVSSAYSMLGNSSSARSVLIHDFATGGFSTKVKLQFHPDAIKKFVSGVGQSNPSGPFFGGLGPGGNPDYTRWDLNGGEAKFFPGGPYDTLTIASQIGGGNSMLLRKNQNPGGFSILLDQKGVGNPSDFVVNLTSIHQNEGLKFTRTLCYEPGDPTFVSQNRLTHDYTLTYNAAGLYDPNFVLYASDYYVMGTANYTRYNDIYESYTGNGAVTSSNNYYDAKKFFINLRQLNVPVVKKNSPIGASIVDGQVITGMNPITNATIVLDKSLSRFPPSGSSYWVIAKQTGTGGYALATPGVDYNLGGGETLTSNLIHLTWLVGGNFRVNCFVEDPAGVGQVYQPTALLHIEFPINTITINNINFPTVTSVVNPSSLFTNVVTGTSPLTGIQTLEIQVSALLSLSLATWTQQIDANPIETFTLTDAEWRTEMATRTDVRCRVKIAGTNNIVQTKNGFGPHIFNLVAGNYEVGYTISPKNPIISDVGALVDPNFIE